MPIVMISGLYQSGQEELAKALVRKTGWPMVNRAQLVDEASELGIRTGRLEMSVIKTPGLSEKLAREKNLYLAFLTAAVCERQRDANLVYYGRAGHLLLPGLDHRLRVGLSVPRERRVRKTADALGLSAEKAGTYLTQLDEDIEHWIRAIHKVDCNDTRQYDVSLSLEHMSVDNVATILCEMAALPDFRPSPLSLKKMEDMHLAAQARLRLAFDQRTAAADPQVHAEDGVVTVTYTPREQSFADLFPAVLSELEGCREIRCTMAETSILWVQEKFDPSTDSFTHITRLAQRWGAAVELLRLIPPDEPEAAELRAGEDEDPMTAPGRRDAATGGVLDDDPVVRGEDGGLARIQEELVSLGRSAGRHTACGGHERIVEIANSDRNYSLVVIGDVFLSKGKSAQTRKTRELALAVKGCLKAPVITAGELRSKVMFGRRQALKLALFALIVAALYLLVFNFQEPVESLLGGDLHQSRPWLTPLLVFLLVPVIAHLYGTVSGLALKLIDID